MCHIEVTGMLSICAISMDPEINKMGKARSYEFAVYGQVFWFKFVDLDGF